MTARRPYDPKDPIGWGSTIKRAFANVVVAEAAVIAAGCAAGAPFGLALLVIPVTALGNVLTVEAVGAMAGDADHIFHRIGHYFAFLTPNFLAAAYTMAVFQRMGPMPG